MTKEQLQAMRPGARLDWIDAHPDEYAILCEANQVEPSPPAPAHRQGFDTSNGWVVRDAPNGSEMGKGDTAIFHLTGAFGGVQTALEHLATVADFDSEHHHMEDSDVTWRVTVERVGRTTR
jgi:hypothetical protein